MNTVRTNTLFSIRYAVRVLERQAVMWGRISGTLKLASLFSGTSALSALMASSPTVAVVVGVLFALLQAIETVLKADDHSANARFQRRDYARLLSRQDSLSDAELEREYQTIVADDDISVWRPIKELAYNDVLDERGLDPAEKYTTNWIFLLISS